MTDKESKALKVKEKPEASTPAEQTRPGLVFTPAVDIFETDKELTVLADMPGVSAHELSIDINDSVLTLSGDVEAPEGADERDAFREFHTGRFYRQFTLSEVIDQAKIEGELTDGVLRLTLPKVEKAAPRRVEVRAG